MSATRLVARPYEPDPPKPPVRSFKECLDHLCRNAAPPPWAEIRPGTIGSSIGAVCFRDLSLGVDTAGGYLAANRQPQTVIEYIGSQLLAARMGAVYSSAVAEDFSSIPVEKTAATFQWLGEGTPVDESSNTFGAVAPSIKWGCVFVEVTRQLRTVSGGLVDRLLARSHFGAVARGVDHAVFHGSGVDGEPIGILNVPGIGSVDGSTFSLLKACSMLKSVEDGNADAGSVCFAMDPATAEILRQRPKATSGERMIFEDGKILDCPAYVSSGIAAGHLFCGDFSQVVVMARDLELLVNRNTKSTFGIIQVLAYWYGDIVVQRPASFCVATGVS